MFTMKLLIIGPSTSGKMFSNAVLTHLWSTSE